ncbi:hypothetical protein Dimus_029184 [Dionaea muscipula]
MPLISISLSKLMDCAAGEAMANLSLELFRAFRDVKKSFIKEQEHCCQLTRVISAKQENSETIRGQLDAILYSKKQKLQKIPSDKAKMSFFANSDASSVTGCKNLKNQRRQMGGIGHGRGVRTEASTAAPMRRSGQRHWERPMVSVRHTTLGVLVGGDLA